MFWWGWRGTWECFGLRVGGRASPSSCQRVQRATADSGGSSVLNRAGMLWGTPRTPCPPAGRERSPGSVTLGPTRVSPSLQRDHMRFLFHKTEDGISIVLAGDVLQRGSRFHPLSSSPQRRSLSLCQGDPSHLSSPQPPNLAPLAAAALLGGSRPQASPHRQRSPAPEVPPRSHGAGCPRPGVPTRSGTLQQGDTHLEPLPALTLGCSSCLPLPAAGLLPNFHHQLANEGLTPAKPNWGALGDATTPTPLPRPQRAASSF